MVELFLTFMIQKIFLLKLNFLIWTWKCIESLHFSLVLNIFTNISLNIYKGSWKYNVVEVSFSRFSLPPPDTPSPESSRTQFLSSVSPHWIWIQHNRAWNMTHVIWFKWEVWAAIAKIFLNVCTTHGDHPLPDIFGHFLDDWEQLLIFGLTGGIQSTIGGRKLR